MNRVPTAILRTPAHRLMSASTLLLQFTGRKTGRSYTTPVVYYRDGDRLLITTDSGWWRNFIDGADVTVLLQGRQRTGRAIAHNDPERLRPVLAEMVRRYPRRYTRLATQNTKPGAARRVLVEITLDPPLER